MVVVGDLLRPEGQRRCQLKSETVRQTRRQHSNHGAGLAIDAYRLADNSAIRTEPFPQSVSQNNGMVSARYSFFRKEVAAHEKRDSLHAEPTWRRAHAIDLFRL